MPVQDKKKRILFFSFLIIFFVALVTAEVQLVLDLAIFPASAQRFDLSLTLILVTMMVAGTVVLVIALTGNEAEESARQLEEFIQQLVSAGGLAEASALLAQYAHKLVPDAGSAVFTYNPHRVAYEAQATCDRQGRLATPPDPCLASLDENREDILEYKLINKERQVGLLLLEGMKPGSLPGPVSRQLETAASLAGLALERFMLQVLADEQSEAMESQRRRIAQDLHDSLAQNIGYLRLKLDQLTCQPVVQLDEHVINELNRMRATAEEAYVQVRSTLDDLDPVPEEDLEQTLRKQGQAVFRKSGIHTRLSQIGAPFVLPPAVRHHILFVAREALYNVVKHAQAGRVQVQLLWLENELILKVTDDGVGFNPEQAPAEGHYGLWIMNHRAREVGGNLRIRAGEEGIGTEVTLWVPRHTRIDQLEPAITNTAMAPAELLGNGHPPVENPGQAYQSQNMAAEV